MALHRLASITIGVPEPEPVRAFYRDLGLGETQPGCLTTCDGGEQLRIETAKQRRLIALTVGVDDADDLGRAAASLGRLGVSVQKDGRSLSAVEPTSGIRVTLALETRVAQKAPPRIPLNVPGEAVRLDARSPAVLASEPARPRRLSHVVTSSTDTAATKRFFVEGLGFCVSDDVPELGASFLRCSTDHHNLLVLPAPLVFLHHSAWEMDDVDAVGRAGAAMVAADASRHVWGLGRHAIGSNYFWYLRDPAGNFAEYTSDLDVIADAEAWKVASSAPVHGLAAWSPPLPKTFLAPDDIMALATGRA